MNELHLQDKFLIPFFREGEVYQKGYEDRNLRRTWR